MYLPLVQLDMYKCCLAKLELDCLSQSMLCLFTDSPAHSKYDCRRRGARTEGSERTVASSADAGFIAERCAPLFFPWELVGISQASVKSLLQVLIEQPRAQPLQHKS